MRDDSGQSKGFGFVSYKDWQNAQKALDKFGNVAADRPDGKPIDG